MRRIASAIQQARIFSTMSPAANRSPHAPAGNGSATGAYTAEEYQRRDDHKPRTVDSEQEETYILALKTDPAHHQAMTALRHRYFPKHLNKLSAHVALFRALPGSQLPQIEKDIQDLVRQTHPFSITAHDPYILCGNHGVAIDVDAGHAKSLFAHLQRQWKGFLSNQDRGFKAHYTIQNKVEDEVMPKRTIEELQKDGFRESKGKVEGLSLYLYDRGYWRLTKTFNFRGGQEVQRKDADLNDKEPWPSLGS